MLPSSLSHSFSLDLMIFLLSFLSALFSCVVEASAIPSLSMDNILVQHPELRDFPLILPSHVHQF